MKKCDDCGNDRDTLIPDNRCESCGLVYVCADCFNERTIACGTSW